MLVIACIVFLFERYLCSPSWRLVAIMIPALYALVKSLVNMHLFYFFVKIGTLSVNYLRKTMSIPKGMDFWPLWVELDGAVKEIQKVAVADAIPFLKERIER